MAYMVDARCVPFEHVVVRRIGARGSDAGGEAR